MIPSRRSRDISEWTTPSAFQLDPHFTDDAPDFQLRDTHYYTAGNHFILHHLDYYILHHNRLKMRNYTLHPKCNSGKPLTRCSMS